MFLIDGCAVSVLARHPPFTKSAFASAVVVRFRSCCRRGALGESARHDGPYGAVLVADPVRIRDELSHHLSRVHDRTGELAGVPGGRLSENAARAVARPVRVLAED